MFRSFQIQVMGVQGWEEHRFPSLLIFVVYSNVRQELSGLVKLVLDIYLKPSTELEMDHSDGSW